jgi:uncharacterized protein with NRDE domain
MCVLTFVPDASNGFIITNNRDENLLRPKAICPKEYKIGNRKAYFPKDAKAGGTWIATNLRFTLCLLNGAFEKHVPTGQYTKSRGMVILDFLENENIELLKQSGCFNGFENFTLVIIEGACQKIYQIVWDGKKAQFNELNWNEAKIWSSCTLYTHEVIKERATLFNAFLEKAPKPTPKQLHGFHCYADLGDIANNLVMRRTDGTITQSISQIISDSSGTRFSYTDLIGENNKSLVII